LAVENYGMATSANTRPGAPRIMGLIRQRIEHGGERLWRLDDFRDLPFAAVVRPIESISLKLITFGCNFGSNYFNLRANLDRSFE
jgi:hypothetical protein